MTRNRPEEQLSVNELLQGHSPEVRLIVDALRDLVRRSAPSARESAHAVWHSIHYHDPQHGYFLGIFPMEDRVNLVFEFGILLPDPENILEGTGKQVRTVRIRNKDEIPAAGLHELILAALALPACRKEKLAMIRSGARPMKGDG
jgi:hypothetical protein